MFSGPLSVLPFPSSALLHRPRRHLPGATNMASALRNLASLKVKDVPTFVKSSLSKEKVMQDTWSWLYKYNEKYVQTGSIRPLTDVMLSVGFLSYAIAWPTEIRHLRHAEEAAKHGNNHH